MKHLVAALFLVSFAIPNQAFAFKWSKCKKVYKSWGVTESKSKNVGSVLMDYLAQMTSQATFQSSTSTSSYVTSTGDCAAFAKAEEERNNYIAETFTEIKMESAEGQGEHVASLATLYGCDSKTKPQFINMLKDNHAQIFSADQKNDSIFVNQRITDNLLKNDALRTSCDLERI